MLRIAFIVTDLSNTRIGGISQVATEIGANLVALGHEVVAYILARQGEERISSLRGIRLRYIEPFPSPNPDYPVVGFSRRAFATFLRDAEKEQFDILQSFNLNGIAYSRCKGRLERLGIPFVMASFETIFMDVEAKWREFLSLPSAKTLAQIVFESYLALFHEKRYLKGAGRVITEDENTAAALGGMGVSRQSIRLIPSGVNVERAEAARAPEVDIRKGRQGPVIGYIGRVDPRKGVQYLVEAMDAVRKRFPDAVLFLAGGSRHGYDARMRQLIESRGLGDCVFLLGRIPGGILPYYRLADVIVIPSLSEGIPITLGEAMASRVPVVITRLPGVVPFVNPADLVYWAEIADGRSLAGAVIAALDDPEKESRVERAREFIGEFTWRKVASRYCDVYRELAGKGKSFQR